MLQSDEASNKMKQVSLLLSLRSITTFHFSHDSEQVQNSKHSRIVVHKCFYQLKTVKKISQSSSGSSLAAGEALALSRSLRMLSFSSLCCLSLSSLSLSSFGLSSRRLFLAGLLANANKEELQQSQNRKRSSQLWSNLSSYKIKPRKKSEAPTGFKPGEAS